jgi:hypothetical protein
VRAKWLKQLLTEGYRISDMLVSDDDTVHPAPAWEDDLMNAGASIKKAVVLGFWS